MPDKTNDTVIAAVMEQLMAEGPQAMAQIVTALMNLAMRMEREQFLAAGHDERAPDQGSRERGSGGKRRRRPDACSPWRLRGGPPSTRPRSKATRHRQASSRRRRRPG